MTGLPAAAAAAAPAIRAGFFMSPTTAAAASSIEFRQQLPPVVAARRQQCRHLAHLAVAGAEERGRRAQLLRPRANNTNHGQTRAPPTATRRAAHSLAAPSPPGLLLGQHVKEALQNGEPIVALESTVITHGLPEPANLELALDLEQLVRAWRPAEAGEQPQQQDADDQNSERRRHDKQLRASRQSSGRAGATSHHREPLGANQCAEQTRTEPSSAPIVTPATVGVVRGRPGVGLSAAQIGYLADRARSSPIKASRRDLPIASALGLSAGTTVSATMAIASSVYSPSRQQQRQRSEPAIKVFATGGTGGVHLGGQLSMDVSADLYEFARSPMGVVSSGFKSFLDTRRSLELLETLGCTVMSLAPSSSAQLAATKASGNSHSRATNGPVDAASNWQAARERPGPSSARKGSLQPELDWAGAICGQDDAARDHHLFPAFFSATNKQKIKTPRLVRDVREAARILFHCLEAPLANRRASLLAVPIPSEFSLDELEDEELRSAMAKVAEIDSRTDLEGKEKTPLILAELNRATKGKTLRANIELLRNNARVGAELAFEYALLANRTGAILADGFAPAQADRVAGLRSSSSASNADLGTNGESTGRRNAPSAQARPPPPEPLAGPLVVGCTMIDMHVSTKIDARFKTNPRHSGVTFEGKPHLTLGGVGRNLAVGLQFLGHRPTFMTSLASDSLGSFALLELQEAGLKGDRLRVGWLATKSRPTAEEPASGDSLLADSRPDSSTANVVPAEAGASSCFALVLVDSIDGQCEYVIANLEAVKAIDASWLEAERESIRKAPLLVADANLSSEAMEKLLELGHQHNVPIFLEPADVLALPRLVGCLKRIQADSSRQAWLQSLLCLCPNLIELKQMLEAFEGGQADGDASTGNYSNTELLDLDQIQHMARELMQTHLPQLKSLLVTLDKRGVLMAVRAAEAEEGQTKGQQLGQVNLMESAKTNHDWPAVEARPVRVEHFAAPHLIERPLSASGAGDSFAAGFIGGLLEGRRLADCLEMGFQASLLALQDQDTIPRSLKGLALKRTSSE